MIKIRRILLSVLVVAMLFSCNKTDYDYPKDTVAGSRITYYADFVYNGAEYVAVNVGDIYTEPGVTATENGVDIPVTIEGAVDTETPGIYKLTYTAVNKDGFAATRGRTVVVYETADDAAANDLSGTYLRTLTGVTSTWTKLAPGVYLVQNPGGAASATSFYVIAINPTGFEISIPEQAASDGSTTSSDLEKYFNTTPAGYEWKIVNAGYGTAVRVFVKQ